MEWSTLSRYANISLRYFSATNGVDIKNHAMEMDSIASTSCLSKALLSREVKLAFPDFSQPLKIITDASALQLGAVVAQNKKAIAFFSRKLNPAQRRYTTTERELLAIVETLKEFRTKLLEHKIRVFTDHKNLT